MWSTLEICALAFGAGALFAIPALAFLNWCQKIDETRNWRPRPTFKPAHPPRFPDKFIQVTR